MSRWFNFFLFVVLILGCAKLPSDLGVLPIIHLAIPNIPTVVPGNESVTVTWDTVKGATSYNLYYDTGSNVDMASFKKVTGATSPRQVTGLTGGTKYAFAVSAVNAGGESGISNVVTATPNTTIVPQSITITTHPQSQTATVGQIVTFKVVAGDTGALTYKWKKNDTIIFGATLDSFSIPNVKNSDAGVYSVVVSNASGGSAISDAATLTVTAMPVAPGIVTQPKSQTVMAGSSVTFSVSATGTGPLIYKWNKDGVTIADLASNSYTIANVANSDAGTYSVIVTNSVGKETSLEAVLTVTATPVAPAITTQPKSQTVTAGQMVTFTVAATGTGQLYYQWEKGSSAISGATASSYSITNVQTGNAGGYSVKVTNSVGSVLSDSAVLTVTAAPVKPDIATQPKSQTVTAGQNVTLSVVASGTEPFTYQWSRNDTAISGATTNSLNFSAVQTVNAGTYTVVVFNSAGNAVSNGAVLTVNAAPAIPDITTQPKSHIVTVGQSATFSVEATGTMPLSYQWKKNGLSIPGDTASSFTISTVAITDSGIYTVTVTNSAGNATSNVAVLTVNPLPVKPSITTQPKLQTVTVGQSATFSVEATGTMPLSYQWKKNGLSIPGDTASSFTISTVAITDSGIYTVTVTNSAGNVTSNGAVLNVNPLPEAPSITKQPTPNTVNVGQSVTFKVEAKGTAPLSYQWYKDNVAINGATLDSLSIQNAQAANAGSYKVVVSNGTLPDATSNGAVLTVNPLPVAPTITKQPTSNSITIPC